MTSLQQTAMGGGSATAKTASYVLVAADAGTTVAMNAAGATTITVNTGLFAAGDTVFIQNLGAGACTVTAGTATVATAGSLILPQNDAGILYFTATGTSIFYDYIQAGAVSPLTTKGDLYTFSTSDARLAVGTNTHVLTADSAEATGLKWAAPASGGGMTLLSTTTLSGASTTISSISGSYKNLQLILKNINPSAGMILAVNCNSDTNKITYSGTEKVGTSSPIFVAGSGTDTSFELNYNHGLGSGNTSNIAVLDYYNYAATDSFKSIKAQIHFTSNVPNQNTGTYAATYRANTAISSLVISCSSGVFNAGTALLYGVS